MKRTCKRALSMLLVLIMLLGVLPMTALAAGPYNSVPLTLTVSSYSAPFLNGSTGQHTVNSYKITKYIDRTTAAGSGANASGSATARFVGSNETGWTLVIDVIVGNYKDTWTTNAKITNKDMSEATGSVTFGMSWNTQGGVSTYISISGAKDLPKPDVTYTLDYNANGGSGAPSSQSTTSNTGSATFTISSTRPTRENYTFLGWSTSSTATTASYQPGGSITISKDTTLYAVWEEKQPDPAPDAPSDFGELKELLGNEIVEIDCDNDDVEHEDKDYALIEDSYDVSSVTGDATSGYTCTVTIHAAKYIEQYNTDIGVTHTLKEGEPVSKTITLSWDNDQSEWVPNNRKVEFDVLCATPATEYKLIYDANGGTGAPAAQTGSSNTGSYTFTVKSDTPTNGDLHFMGWADSASATAAQYQGGSTITLYKAAPTKTIYAVWGDHSDADEDGKCDIGGECLHDHDNDGYCTEDGCDHGDNCCPKEPAPSENDVAVLLDGAVTVTCINDKAGHGTKTYGPLTDGYIIGSVTGDKATGYYCDVTIKLATYVAEYNKTLPGHKAADGETDKTVTLQYTPNDDGTAGTWTVKSGVPVTFKVVCETPESEVPTAPTDEDLADILRGSFVTVDCISKSAHSSKSLSYGLLPYGYTIGEVKGNAEDGYTCEVTFYADVYQAKYNDDTDSKHELDPAVQPESIVLYWDKETGWTAPDGYAVRFTVTCDDDRSYYTVTYTDGVPGATIFYDQTYYVLAGSKTPAFVGALSRPGYVFAGWTPAVAATVTKSVTYTATWKRIVDTVEKDDPFYVRDLNYTDHVSYINGYPDGTVRPTGDITRAEAATIFFRLMTDSARDRYWSTSSRFTDVADSAWYAVAVATLDKYGAIVDSENGEFRPDEPITRAELAVMAAQFCTLKYDGTKTSFTDVSRNHWAAKQIALIEQAGWIVGHNGKFRPNDTITRAETITIINRMLHRGVDDEGMLKGMITFSDNARSAWYYEAVQEAANSHTYTYSNRWIPGEGFHYENWQKLVKNPDWVAIERGWKDAHK